MGTIIGLTIAAIIIVFLAIGVKMYNALVKARQRVKNSWSQMDVQLQRRYDMMPNLVEVVKGYMKHEQDTFIKVTELRSTWKNSETISQKVEIGNDIEKALNKILAISENYPELKANETFIELQVQIKELESKIAFSRQFYNDSVTIYNTKLEVFPSNIIAGMFHFTPEVLLNAESEEARENIKISF